MRLRKSDLHRRVKADLGLRFEANGLTSFAGLEFIGRYFRQLDLAARIRRNIDGDLPSSDYAAWRIVLVLLTLLIVGGRRVRHLRFLQHDPLVERLSGLRRLPTPRSPLCQ